MDTASVPARKLPRNNVIVAGCDAFKYCAKCDRYKPLLDFYRDNKRETTLRSPTCKPCMKQYADANRSRVRITVRRWQDNNRARTRELATARARTIKGRFNHLHTDARAREIPVDLTIDQYAQLVSSGTCFYMGEPLGKTGGGLDRKNSQLGYTFENCVPCCLKCNRIRGEDNITHEEMFEVVKLLKRLRGIQ